MGPSKLYEAAMPAFRGREGIGSFLESSRSLTANTVLTLSYTQRTELNPHQNSLAASCAVRLERR